MSAMKIPDKLPYTKGEKTAEIVCGGICAAIVILELVLLILGKITSGAVIILVSSLVVYGILSAAYQRLYLPREVHRREIPRCAEGALLVAADSCGGAVRINAYLIFEMKV